MFNLRHFLIFLCYSGLAAGTAAVAPLVLPDVRPLEGILSGALVLLTGGFLHESYCRIEGEQRRALQLLSLRQSITSLQGDISGAKQEADALRGALEQIGLGDVEELQRVAAASGSAARNSEAAERRVDAVIAEVKVLQTLIERLSEAEAKRQAIEAQPAQTTAESDVAPATDWSPPFAGEREEAVRTARTWACDAVEADEEAIETKPITSVQPHPLAPETLARAAAVMGAEVEAPQADPRDHPVTPAVPLHLSEREILEIARQALQEDRVDLVLQTIVTLPQRKRRFYECFSRLRTRDGHSVLPEQYIALAEKAGFVTEIDNLLLFRCVQLVRKIQRKGEELDFFCNISGHTLSDAGFFADFHRFLHDNRALLPNLVFEISQADYDALPLEAAKHLEELQRLGCRLSLDQVVGLQFDPESLVARGILFLKLSAEVVLRELAPEAPLLESCRAAGITLIVDKIEAEETLRELLDYKFAFAQGYLFSEPRLARPAA